ncbi:MAG TPA: glycosyltransferase family 39 protein [Dehalococcoidia bacterium]
MSMTTEGLTITLPRAVASRRVLQMRLTLETALAAVLLPIFLALAMVIPSLGINIFNTPDETSDYLFTKTFAEHGRLWYTEEYTSLDEENLLHPRGAMTHDGRIVPYSFLGLPLVYGVIYRVVGDHLQYISFVLAAVSAWALYRSTSLLFGARAWEAWTVALGFSPLIYYLNRPYMNAAPALTLFFVGIWLFARYLRGDQRRDLKLAACAMALVVLFRYEYVLFVTPLALWALYVKHGSLLSRSYRWDCAAYFAALLLLVALPVAALNHYIYGDVFTYGPGLFNEVYFPERGATPDASWLESLGRSLRSVLLPSYPFDPLQVLTNVPRLTAWTMPVFTLTAALGIAMLIRARSVSLWRMAPLSLLVVYVLFYRGSGNTWDASGTEPGLEVAVVRYWLPVYTLLFFLAVYALRAMRDQAVKLVLVGALLLTGPVSVYSLADGSLLTGRDTIKAYEAWVGNVLLPNTEENALIFVGRTDKRIAAYRDVATWWNGAEFYDVEKVAASMVRVVPNGRPLYIYKEPEVDIPALNDVLARYGLEARPVARTGFYRIEPKQPTSASPRGAQDDV